MADEPTTPPATGDTPPPKEEPKGEPAGDLGDAGKRALEAERKARRDAEAKLKELEPLATKAKELEDAAKSETQKLTEDRDGHKTRADKAELDAMRYRVALDKGLTATQAKRLVGSTEEELAADADDLIASFGGDTKKPAGGRPKERLRPGTGSEAEPEETDPRKLAEKVPRR